ncbi:MAG: primosomal protein N' [Clostridia bacterium]|nr:primosomal protein N' [Clostridia bacterium]
MRIAEVVIANNSRELNKKFSYLVPDDINVLPGARVVVPFGRGNKTVEGIVTGFTDKTDFTKLKEIARVIDEKPLCTPKLLELAEYIQKTSVCTYYQALRLVVASGTKIKTTRWITLLNTDIDIEKTAGRSASKKKLLEILSDAGGTVDYGAVAWVSNINTAIKSLEKEGIISLDDTVAENVKSKLVRMVRLTDMAEYTEDWSSLHKRAPKQFKMLEILRQTGDVSAADIVAFSDGSYAALNALEQKGIIEYYDLKIYRNAFEASKYERTEKKHLTQEQQYVLDSLVENHKNGDTKPNLIRGVTGSGKTEVFLQIIEYYINMGKQAIVLVPEISLTPQMVDRFVGRFGEKVSVLHSALSQGEKFDEWTKILKGEVCVAIGARSAVFAPFENLGIIIIDEEHETTYKSDNAPRYDAKRAAMYRCKNEGAMLVMASATPSVSTYYRAKTGMYNLYEMKNRHNFMSMPKIETVDMREELKIGNTSVFSRRLLEEIDINIQKGQQTILFLNRRGFNSFVMCRDCGEAIKCRNCSVSMTYHKNSNVLKCHYCGYEQTIPEICPKCNSTHIRYMGTGTEKVEEEIAKIYGEKSFIRMDADTTSGKNSHEAILNRFQSEKIPILLGTQMVTKGLDFPNVTLVGVLAADISLNIDDFRAAERTFGQITQVCGRAGRGDIEGRAIVQTYQPEHYVLEYAKNHDYESFYENEIEIRKMLKNPPFNDFVLLMMQGEREDSIIRELGRIANRLRSRGLVVMGPVPAPYSRIKNKYRWRIIVRHHKAAELLDLLHTIADYYAKSENQLFIDINPNSMN